MFWNFSRFRWIFKLQIQRNLPFWNLPSFILAGRLDTRLSSIFFYQVFLSQTLTTHRTAGEGKGSFLFDSTISAYSRIYKHLFDLICLLTLYVRWLWHIFNRTACIYQIATRWYLPPCRITIWLIDDVMLVFVCLIDDLTLRFCVFQFDTGNRWTRSRIDHHSCITSEPTNNFLIFPNILRS